MLNGTQVKLDKMFYKVTKLRNNAGQELDIQFPRRGEGIEKLKGHEKKPDLVDDTLDSVTQLVDRLRLPTGTHSPRTDGEGDDAAEDTESVADGQTMAE